MNILIGADIVPTKTNEDFFIKSDKSLIGDELYSILETADYRIFNLEVPLVGSQKPIKKNGPNLIAKPETINGYSMIKTDLLTLANNHILDQDEQGLASTIEILNANNIKHVGAGKNLEEASKPFVLNIDNKKVGVYACCEHEFSIASNCRPGANPFDPFESLDHVFSLKKVCDFVIVLYHGGKEHYRYPSPCLQKTCRKLIDKGADLVVCQHSHCVGCEENYRNGKIVYGQGNFIFDLMNNDFWQTGLLIKIGDEFKIDYIPIVKNGQFVRLADIATSKSILDAFYQRSKSIMDEGFVYSKYREFALKNVGNYLVSIQGRRTFFGKAMNKLTSGAYYRHKTKSIYNLEKLTEVENIINCEAHRELFLEGIKAFNGRD